MVSLLVMQKKNLYIIIEHKNREFLSQLLLSTFAVKKGLRVFIGNYRGIFKLLSLKKKKSGMLLMKGGLNEELTKFIKKKCNQYIILDQEVSPGYKLSKYTHWVSERFFSRTVKYIDLYCCLNDIIVHASKKNYQFKKEKIKLFKSGWPRIDTWLPIFEKFHLKKIKSIKKKYKKFIFFSSDFGVTCQDDIQEEVERIPWGMTKDEAEKNKKKRFVHATNAYNEYKKFLSFLREIDKSKDCPKILIRSHPGESLKGWHNDLINLKNIKYVEPTDVIDPYFYACSGFLHRGSTTAYQAILAKKPISFIYLHKHVKENLLYKENLMKSSKIINNPKEFLAWSKGVFNKKSKDIKMSKKIKKELNLNKEYASQVMVKKLDSLMCETEEKLDYNFSEITLKDKFMFKIKNTIKYFFSLLQFEKKIIFNDFKIKKLNKDGIKSKEIKNTIKKFNKLLKLNIKSKIHVKQISDNVVEIEA